ADSSKDLLAHLWRGGAAAYYFSLPGQNMCWASPDAPGPVPGGWQECDVYFNVHPLSHRPARGRGGCDDIAAVNCLFADFDGKDEVMPDEYALYLPDNMGQTGSARETEATAKAKEQAFCANRESYKGRIFARLTELPLYPTVVVDTGGGYHCYWFLEHTVLIDENN